MRIYRNLGPICFQGQTDAFQLFSVEQSTYLFQPKQTSPQANLFQQIAAFYNNYLHTGNFKAYQQTDKTVSLIVSNCKQQQLSQIDCNSLCDWMLQATKIVQKVSQIVPGFIGDFSGLQFFNMGNRKIFVYVPFHETKSHDQRQRLQIQGLAKLTNSLKAEKDMPQQLLTKKIAKCKTLQEIIQELTYFSNVYGYGVNKKYQKLMKLEQPKLDKRVNKNDKSKRKFNMFQIDIKRSKPTFYSHHQNNYVASQPRNSSTAIHISMPEQKRIANSLHTTSQRQLRPYSPSRRSLKNQYSSFNLKNSKVKESIEMRDKDKEILSRKVISRQQFHNNSVNQNDEERLLKRLQNRKKEACKLNQIDFTKSIGFQQKATQELQTNQENKIKQIEQVTTHKQSPREAAIKSHNKIEIDQQKSHIKLHIKQKQAVRQNRENSYTIAKDANKETSKPSIKYQSPRLSKSKKTIVNQLSTPLTPLKNAPKKQQLIPPPLIQSSLTSKYTNQPEKKLKKKKINLKLEEISNSQLQIIDLDAKPKPLKLQQDTLPHHEAFNQTRKNSINQQIASQMEQTKRMNQKQPNLQEKLNQRLKNVDFMGIAVANTIGHLVGYQKIFWQLPMFFIYRSFYLERVSLFERLQRLPYVTSPLKDIQEENSKICQSVTKLIKIITKRLKKDDPTLLTTVKAYLNLQQKIDCSEATKIFLKQYILSLEEAIKSKYSELTLHLLQIVDAYLIYFGQSIDCHTRSKAQRSKEQMNQYLGKQLKTLRNYY